MLNLVQLNRYLVDVDETCPKGCLFVEVFISSVVALLLQLLFTVKLEAGNRQKAMKRLRVPPLGGQVD